MSKQDNIHLALFDKKDFWEKMYKGINRELLACIDKFIKSKKVKAESIKGIMVVVGAGSFTSTRLACVVANSFAYALHIPTLAIEKKGIEKVQELIPKLLQQTPGNYISATYSGQPNIGKVKK